MAEIVSVTKSYVPGIQDSSIFFEQVVTLYDDESSNTTKTRVGPADQLAADQADKILATTREQARLSHPLQNTKRILSEANAVDTSIETLTALSPLKKIQERYQADLLKSGWTIDEGAGFVPLVFTVTAQGVLRYSVNGAATKQARMYGAIIRLNNYPATGTDTDFYQSESGNRYYALPNKAFTIKVP